MSQPLDSGPSPWRGVKLLITIALVVVVGVGVVSVAASLGRSIGGRFTASNGGGVVDVEPGQPINISIPEGATAKEIAAILQENGVIRSATQFEATVRAEGVGGLLRAGSYDLETGMNPDDVILVLQRGPLAHVFRVTIIEGRRVSEILADLSTASGIPVEEFERALTNGQVTTNEHELPAEPTLADWEGLLFPDTYEFSDRSSAASILQKMSDTLTIRMNSIDWSAFEDAGFTRYQGIIIASLIESEVQVADERPLVSSVVRNRLRDGQRLEIDATILYALGSRDPRSINTGVDSPYNTYRVDGLPPTPISAPGLASLQAAAAPAETDYHYYVLSSSDGSHTFSVTYEEHLAAVEKARQDGLLGP